jgi:uncharacterized protein YegP (UPF0339 family)
LALDPLALIPYPRSDSSRRQVSVVHIFKGEGRQPWFVRLVADNGQILSISEGYFSKWNAKRAAKRMYPNKPLKVVS